MMVITADAPSGKTTNYRYPEWDYYAMGDDSGDFNIWYLGRSVMFNKTVTIQVNDGGSELASFSFSLTGFSGVNTFLSPTSNKSTSLGQKISYELTALLITKGS